MRGLKVCVTNSSGSSSCLGEDRALLEEAVEIVLCSTMEERRRGHCFLLLVRLWSSASEEG